MMGSKVADLVFETGIETSGVSQGNFNRGRYVGWPGDRAAISRKGRQIFPLPIFACPPKKQGVSRTVAKRRNRIRKVVENCNCAISALNWLSGCRTVSEGQCNGMQQMVQARVDGLVFSQKPSGAVPSPQEALEALLRGAGPYDWSSANEMLASYRSELVSLPDDISGCSFLVDILGSDDRLYLKEQSEQMMRSDLNGSADLVVPYWDPVLKHNRKEYNRLVERLTSIGYFNFTRHPLCQVGIFFVWKSSKTRLRMITDARLSNMKFKDAPPVSLMTSEGLGRIELQLDEGLWQDESLCLALSVHVGLSDVENCFHRLRVPIWLSRYFCWSAVPAKTVGLVGVELEGKVLGPLDPVYPCAGSLCQGFSWALFFAQRANEQMCQKISPLQDARLSCDRGCPIVLHVGKDHDTLVHYYVYVDNLGIIHTDAGVVEKALDELVLAFDGCGLILHGSEVSSGEVKALGCLLEGSRMCTRLTGERLWKVHQGIAGLVRRKKCTGVALEKVIGHCTFCGLMNRMSLSCFHVVYKFIQRHYHEAAFLWSSVVDELRAFQGCLFLTVQEWDRQWHNLVGSSDSSLSGYGVCHSWWPKSHVAQVGRVLERSRFKRAEAHSARESALTAAGLVNDAGKWRAADGADLRRLHEEGWALDETFPEVPSSGLRRELWAPKLWGRWFHKENILILEARALLKGLKRIAFTRWGHSLRQLLLCDNMSVVLAVERFRAKNFKLLVIIKEIAAICFARNIHLAIRWIPSELNVSDEPSRIFEPGSSDLLVDLLHDCWPKGFLAPYTQKHAAAVHTAASAGECRDVGAEASERPKEGVGAASGVKVKGASGIKQADARLGLSGQCSFPTAGETTDPCEVAGDRIRTCTDRGKDDHTFQGLQARSGRSEQLRQQQHIVRAAGRQKRREEAFFRKQAKRGAKEDGGPVVSGSISEITSGNGGGLRQGPSQLCQAPPGFQGLFDTGETSRQKRRGHGSGSGSVLQQNGSWKGKEVQRGTAPWPL